MSTAGSGAGAGNPNPAWDNAWGEYAPKWTGFDWTTGTWPANGWLTAWKCEFPAKIAGPVVWLCWGEQQFFKFKL